MEELKKVLDDNPKKRPTFEELINKLNVKSENHNDNESYPDKRANHKSSEDDLDDINDESDPDLKNKPLHVIFKNIIRVKRMKSVRKLERHVKVCLRTNQVYK